MMTYDDTLNEDKVLMMMVMTKNMVTKIPIDCDDRRAAVCTTAIQYTYVYI